MKARHVHEQSVVVDERVIDAQTRVLDPSLQLAAPMEVAHAHRAVTRGAQFLFACALTACGGRIVSDARDDVDGDVRVDGSTSVPSNIDAAPPIDAGITMEDDAAPSSDGSTADAAPVCSGALAANGGVCAVGLYFVTCKDKSCLAWVDNSCSADPDAGCWTPCEAGEFGVWCPFQSGGSAPPPSSSCRSVDASVGAVPYCCPCGS